jgi:hypothetical protein
MVSQKDLHSTETEVGTALMAGGLVAAGNEAVKMVEKKDKFSIPTAAIGAGAAYVGYKMVHDATDDKSQPFKPETRGRQRSYSRSPSRSRSRTPPHHGRHLLEEALGLYGLTKEVMGDKRHHILHILEEVVGAIGVFKDLKKR